MANELPDLAAAAASAADSSVPDDSSPGRGWRGQIVKRPGVCGGSACIAGTRVPVWILANARLLGYGDQDMFERHPFITPSQLAAAWSYAEEFKFEIDEAIRLNDEV